MYAGQRGVRETGAPHRGRVRRPPRLAFVRAAVAGHASHVRRDERPHRTGTPGARTMRGGRMPERAGRWSLRHRGVPLLFRPLEEQEGRGRGAVTAAMCAAGHASHVRRDERPNQPGTSGAGTTKGVRMPERTGRWSLGHRGVTVLFRLLEEQEERGWGTVNAAMCAAVAGAASHVRRHERSDRPST